MATSQTTAADPSARNSAADIDDDVRTSDVGHEKSPTRKAKPGEAWKRDEVHQIPHK